MLFSSELNKIFLNNRLS